MNVDDFYSTKDLPSIDSLVGDSEPRYDEQQRIEDQLTQEQIINSFKGRKRKIIQLIFEGYNFKQIERKLKLHPKDTYTYKREFMVYFRPLYSSMVNRRLREEEGKNIIFFYLLTHTVEVAEIYKNWDNLVPLNDYERPNERLFSQWVHEIYTDLKKLVESRKYETR